MIARFITVSVLALLLLGGSGTRADDRVLLIGVGRFADMPARLPGIAKDLEMMREVSRLMDYTDEQVRVLEDRQATLAGIRDGFHNWLQAGATAGDRVLIYFSGHGSQVPDDNGDEADGSDEVLVPYDVLVDNDAATLHNVLLDDEFAVLLAQIRAREILVLIDACHSGTATRAFGTGVSKFLYYKGMSVGSGDFMEKNSSGKAVRGARCVVLTACRDDERAVSTAEGSLFTRGILQVVRWSARFDRALSPVLLREGAAAYIARNAERYGVRYHPQAYGIAEKMIHVRWASPQPAAGDPWRELEALVAAASEPLALEIEPLEPHLGDSLIIRCRIPHRGYLNVIHYHAGDREATVLFPNRFHPENRVRGGTTVQIPAAADRFVLRARPPLGPSLVAVFLTRTPINAYRDGTGLLNAVFKTYSDRSFRSIWVEQREDNDGLAAARAVVQVRERRP